jgi:hypothetical protein
VFDLGYCSEDSFGASAWLVVRPHGNVLVDSPRFTEALVGPIAALGGVRHVALTHRDDVADARRWAERFDATTWIHTADHSAAPWATGVLTDECEIQPGFVAVPVPGHTKGSVAFLLDDRWLFTGDSLAWSNDHDDLVAFRSACWFSWKDKPSRCHDWPNDTVSPQYCRVTAPAISVMPMNCTTASSHSLPACAADTAALRTDSSALRTDTSPLRSPR